MFGASSYASISNNVIYDIKVGNADNANIIQNIEIPKN